MREDGGFWVICFHLYYLCNFYIFDLPQIIKSIIMIRKQDALDYPQLGRPGKIEVVSSKPCSTQRDLSLAYTPGVADPCLDIEKNPDDAY